MAVRQGKKAAGAQAGAATEAGAAVPPAPKSKSHTVPAIVVAVALLGAAFLMRPSGAAPAQAAAAEPAAEEVVAGPVVTLDPITMNLHGGDHLKVGLALQLSAEAVEGGGHGPGPLENPTAFGAKALDVAIQVLGAHTMAELTAPGGRDEAKAKLSAKVAEEYHDQVLEVYFTQFVIA